MTTQDRKENLRSAEYLDAMATAWSVVRELHKAGVPVQRLIPKARTLYRQAWRDEVRRRRVG